jgi:hypothetical protein
MAAACLFRSVPLVSQSESSIDNLEQIGNIQTGTITGPGLILKNGPIPQRLKPRKVIMLTAFSTDDGVYERACDQAIAMCDGNLRSTIKALIMANEYLEAELQELRATISCGCMPNTLDTQTLDTQTSDINTRGAFSSDAA